MKVITTNLLNRFWKNGIKPVKDSVMGKLDSTKVVNSLLTTAAGFALDARQGKALDDKIAELNSKLASVAYDKTAVNFKEAWEARYCRCEKTGKIVHFNARIYTGTIMKNNRYIISATCNPAIKPAIDSNLTAVAGDYSLNDTVACQCCYLSDGTIELRVPADGKVYVNINGSYVTV